MNLKEIKELLQLMKDHDLSEVEIEKDGLRLKLKKGGSGVTFEKNPENLGIIGPFSKQTEGMQPSAPKEVASRETESQGIYIVRSPMVGTFYASPAPDQPAYISVGQAIRKGSVLCIVEAIKLINEIKY